VSIIEEKGKGSACNNATKGIAKGKGTGKRKEVEESGRRRGGMCGQAMRSAAREKEELSRRAKEEGRRALWKKYTKGSMPTGAGMVHGGGNSLIPNLQRMWEQGMSCRR